MKGLPWGGSEVLWHSTAMHSLQQGDEVFVSVHDWGKIHAQVKLLKDKGAAVYFRQPCAYTGRIQKLIQLLTRKKPANKDYQAIIDFKPDIVFISQAETFDFAWSFRDLYSLLIKHNISYSLVCHSLMQQYSFIPPKEIYPGAIEVFKNAKHVFFVAKRQWHLTERRLVSKLTNAHFTWNPLNLDLPQSSMPYPDTKIIQMAIVGAFLGYKGQDTALEVLSGNQWKDRNWRLNIYGSGEGEEYLKDLAKYYHIKEKVVFHGHVKDIKQVWMQNHILLIPSSQEGLPISLTEAMACARPSVVTDVGGNCELVTEHETGFIAASPTSHHYAQALETAWMHKDEWRQLGINSFEKIKSIIDETPHITIYGMLKKNLN